jgi:hypothetical protein
MGIPDEDIIPVDLFDLPNYSGEECILVFNGPKHEIYPQFAPIPSQIHPVFFSLSVRTQLTDEEIADLRRYGPVGCREEESVYKLQKMGIDAFLSGCLTLTLPRRAKTKNQNTVFIVDAPQSLMPFIPDYIRKDAVNISHVEYMTLTGDSDRFSIQDAELHHKKGYALINRYRDEAKMVITSRLHCAAPCIAMGIPVILAHDSFDMRFGFIDKFLPLYTPDRYSTIDWNPKEIELEAEKSLIMDACIQRINTIQAQQKVHKLFMSRIRGVTEYRHAWDVGVEKVKNSHSINKYAIWGMDYVMGLRQILPAMKKYHPDSVFCIGIDEEVAGQFENVEIIHPENINDLPVNMAIIAITRKTREAAKILSKTDSHLFVLLDRSSVEYCQK